MKLAVMQPYFFPYLGYFQLIHSTDLFVVMDDVQFNKGGWQNRNRLLNYNFEPVFFTIPIKKCPHSTLIKDIEVAGSNPWRKSFKSILNYYVKAPNYKEIRNMVLSVIEKKHRFMIDYCIDSLSAVTQYLGMKFETVMMSGLDYNKSLVSEPGEHSLFISEYLKASTYINMPKGNPIFSEEKFRSRNINLLFLNPELSEYKQFTDRFVANLSVIDALMFLPPEKVLQIIRNDYTLMTKSEMTALGKQY